MNSKLFQLGIDPLYIIIVLAAFTIVTFIVSLIVMYKCTRMWHRYDRFMRGKDTESLEELINQLVGEVTRLTDRNDELEKKTLEVVKDGKSSIKKFAIKKYNAFKEAGGKLSFSLVLLDQDNDGFIMTCMHANGPSYTYIKEIIHGESYVSLSVEETEALEEAIKYTKYD